MAINPSALLRRAVRQQMFGRAFDIREATPEQLALLHKGNERNYTLSEAGHPTVHLGRGALLGGGDVGPASAEAQSTAENLSGLLHRSAGTEEVVPALLSLSQLLRRRGGKVGRAAAGGKPAATVGGRPYLP